MQPPDFSKVFAALTGTPPFPWQSALYVDFISGRFHSLVNLPTGLGKTSIVAVWLCALATKPQNTPRRLVYVVNRRTVVDQTTSEVERWGKNLEAAGIESTFSPLCAVPLAKNESPLAISTLRGQFADNRAWSADPARPAVIIGTVDMIGSRLLFSGYGTGFKTRPHHAGFLGQDALLVHDEAHLEPAFQRLLESIVAQQVADRDPRPLRLIALSATNRSAGDDDSPPFALTAADLADSTVRQRFHAAKKPALHPIADEKKELAAKLVELALARRESNRAVLIFARNVEVVQRVAAELEKAKLSTKPVTLTGTLRGWERDRLVKHPIFQRFLPAASRVSISEPIPTGTVYLVATSAGEVGVNLSADDLVCDLSTFESMAQRLGRVNRFGELTDSTIDIVHPHAFDYETSPGKQQGKDHVEIAREHTLTLFQQLEKIAAASPAALAALDPVARSAAFSPEPTILPATDILFDTWSLTTIRDRLPGRPSVEPYLHGVAEWEPPQTQIAWRTEVEIITDLDGTASLQELYPPEELLADYPLRSHELLRDRSSRVFEQLKKLAAHTSAETLTVWLVEQDGQVTVLKLADLLTQRDPEEALHHRTLLLPPSAGGLRSDGSLDGDAPPSVSVKKDIADLSPGVCTRQRIWSDGPASSVDVPAGFRLIRPPIDTRPSSESSDDDAVTINNSEQGTTPSAGRYWYWFESTQALDGANLHYAQASVLLEVHTKDVEALARSIAEKLGLSADLIHAISLAARFHDAGKDRSGWQKGIGNPTPAIPLAKAGRRLLPRETGDRYRHEFGSLLDVAAHPDFLALPDASQDVVLHLIAAHHGRARPHFPVDEVTDPATAFTDVQALAGEVPLRFARLQRRFGRWGLAYLESILRAADYAASANPSSTLEETK